MSACKKRPLSTRRVLAALLLGAAAALHLLSSCGQQGLNKIKVARYEFQPYDYTNPETGEREGFYHEILEHVARNQGLELSYVDCPGFEEHYRKVVDGECDMSVSVTITPQRQKRIDFSWPFDENAAVLVLPADADPETDLGDLSDKTIGAMAGVEEQACREYEEYGLVKDVVVYKSTEKLHRDLAEKKIDAALNSRINSLYFQKNVFPGKFILTDKVLLDAYLAFGVNKRRQYLLKALNRGLRDLIKSGEYTRLFKKCYGELLETGQNHAK